MMDNPNTCETLLVYLQEYAEECKNLRSDISRLEKIIENLQLDNRVKTSTISIISKTHKQQLDDLKIFKDTNELRDILGLSDQLKAQDDILQRLQEYQSSNLELIKLVQKQFELNRQLSDKLCSIVKQNTLKNGQKSKIDKDTFLEACCIDDDTTRLAVLFGVSDQTIRNYKRRWLDK